MARDRMLRKDFWTDEKIVELDAWTRLLFMGLWTHADDFGYIGNSPKRIKMLVFPGDDVDVSGGLQRLLEDSLLIRLDFKDEPNGVLKVTNWERHQKVSHPATSKYHEHFKISGGLQSTPESSAPVEFRSVESRSNQERPQQPETGCSPFSPSSTPEPEEPELALVADAISPRPASPLASEVQQFVPWWQEAYSSKWNTPYKADKAEWGMAKRLLKLYGQNRLRAVVKAFIYTPTDATYPFNGGRTVRDFNAHHADIVRRAVELKMIPAEPVASPPPVMSTDSNMTGEAKPFVQRRTWACRVCGEQHEGDAGQYGLCLKPARKMKTVVDMRRESDERADAERQRMIAEVGVEAYEAQCVEAKRKWQEMAERLGGSRNGNGQVAPS